MACHSCGGGTPQYSGAYTAPAGITVFYVLNNLTDMECVLLDDDGFCFPFNTEAEALAAAAQAGVTGVPSAFTV